MGLSLVSSQSGQSQQDLISAIQFGARIGAQQREQQLAQQAADQRAAAIRQQQLSDRQAEWQHEWSMKALDWAHQAEVLREKDGKQYFTDKLNAYTHYLDETYRYWDDVSKNGQKYSPNTLAAASANVQWAINKRKDVGSIDPSKFDQIHGIPALSEVAPYQSFQPEFSDAYLQQQQLQAAREQQSLGNSVLTGQLLRKRLSEPSPADVRQQRDLQHLQNSLVDAHSQMQGVLMQYNSAGRDLETASQQKRQIQAGQPVSNQVDEDEAQKRKYRAEGSYFAVAPKLFSLIENPDVVPNDGIRKIQSALKQKFNNLETPEDLNKATHYLHDNPPQDQDGYQAALGWYNLVAGGGQ